MENLPKDSKEIFLGICIIVAALIIGGVWVFTSLQKNIPPQVVNAKLITQLGKEVFPGKGVILPVVWGDLGKQMVEAGVIDQKKFEELYSQRDGLDEAGKRLLLGSDNGKLMVTKENSGLILNLLWAFGLGNKNEILEKEEMTDKIYGGDPSRFASTGGWELSTGKVMDHYSQHSMIELTPEQQALVDKVSKNIYRPCCGNSTHFPDCNHGMAMLGFLELMAGQGVNENAMYKAALVLNSYWFPDTYLTIAQYLKSKGIAWNSVDPKEILGVEYSSAQGFQQIQQLVAPINNGGNGGCGA